MPRATLIVTLIAVLGLGVACTEDTTSSRGQTIESCYDTGYGVKCVATPYELSTVARDVNGDALLDTFLCADAESASDSDSLADDGEDSDESDGDIGEDVDDDMDADSESGSDSDSESDNDCGVSEEDDSESDDDGTSESDADDDGDADTVPDELDCDCIDETNPPEEPPVN